MLVYISFLLVGAISGVLAGLLGVGGGTIIVPFLVMIFSMSDTNPEYIQHMALATSLATIIVTSISSSKAHHAHKAVRWDIVKKISIGILFGTFFGGIVASSLSHMFLTVFFVVFLYLVAIQMLLNMKPKQSRELPGSLMTTFVGSIIGVVSSLVGIGGGSLSVPFMTYCNIPMHTAVGTSAAIGFPIAVAGTIGYVVGGWNIPDLPFGTIGYVNIPAFICISVTCYITAPLGAKLSNNLPIKTLKKFFAIFLIFIATNMLVKNFILN